MSSDQELVREIGLIVRRGVWTEAAAPQIAMEVAERPYDFAMGRGAAFTGLWLVGPRAFYREASTFVRAWGSL